MRRERLSYANVMATLALFVALGGVGYAAVKIPTNSVGSKQIKADAVKASEQGPNSVDGSNLIDASISGADVENESIGGNHIVDGSIGGNDVANSAIGGAMITDESIGTADLADQSVTRAKMAPAPLNTPTLEDCAPGTPWQPVPGLPPRYWKDNENVVHLQGAVQCSVNITGASIFQVPRAFGDVYDPAGPAGSVVRFATLAAGQSIAQVAIVQNTFTTGVVYDAGTASNSENYISLDGLTYLAA